MTSRKKFNEKLRRLRHHYPTPVPTQVRFVSAGFLCKRYGEPVHGGTIVGGGSAVIHIDAASPSAVAIDTLIHEWAHVHDDPEGQRLARHEHHNGWGECFARAYRASHTPIERKTI